ncbi:MAG: RND transporter, partial [Oxalobacteraceae bacterium]|nr:RND transporter [Oxalobacteraceae bacterium]
MKKRFLIIVLSALLGACSFKRIGPDYRTPPVPLPAHFKEADGWKVAQPADASPREPWWNLFHDPLLNELAPRVAVS